MYSRNKADTTSLVKKILAGNTINKYKRNSENCQKNKSKNLLNMILQTRLFEIIYTFVKSTIKKS